MTEPRKYVVLTVEDAGALYGALIHLLSKGSDIVPKLRERLQADTGADLEDVVTRLTKLEVCAACSIEGQSSHCSSLVANKQGRRLRRLLERARGERAPERQERTT